MNVLPFLWQSLILFILISHVWTRLKLGWVTTWKLEIISPVFDRFFLILFVVVLKTDIRSRATKESNFFQITSIHCAIHTRVFIIKHACEKRKLGPPSSTLIRACVHLRIFFPSRAPSTRVNYSSRKRAVLARSPLK